MEDGLKIEKGTTLYNCTYVIIDEPEERQSPYCRGTAVPLDALVKAYENRSKVLGALALARTYAAKLVEETDGVYGEDGENA